MRISRFTAWLLALSILIGFLPLAEAKAANNPYAGKTISILGDSISTFAGVSNDPSVNATLSGGAIYYNDGTLGVYRADTWWQQTIDLLDMKLLVNNSWSGSTVLHTRSGTVGAYVDRCVQLHNDKTGEEPDVIAVFLGTNDFSYYQGGLGNASIDYASLICDNGNGTFIYATPKSTCEAYAVMLHKMTVRYPNAKIYCMGLLPRREPDHDGKDVVPAPTQFNGELAKVISHFGCTLVDLENCGISPNPENFDTYITDMRVHPGPLGMDKMTQALIDVMLGQTSATCIVSQKLVNVTANASGGLLLAGSSYTVNLQAAEGFEELTVTVTMDGNDVTASVYANGKIHIPSVTGDVMITASASVDDIPDNYYWEVDGNSFVNVAVEEKKLSSNAVTQKAGTVTDGVISNAYFKLEKPVVLRHDLPWAVEWHVSGGNWTGMLFSATEKSSAPGNSYLFKTTQNTGFIGFGESASASFHNYGVALASLGIDTAVEHTYRVENRIAADGSNMAYLMVDGKDCGPMYNFFVGGNSDQGKRVTWINGRDFCFAYIGANGHPIHNCKLSYLAVWEGGEHQHTYSSTTTAPTCTEQGYTTYTCTVCGDSYTETVAMTEHIYRNGICVGCGKKDFSKLTYVAFGDSITYGVDGNYRGNEPGYLMPNPYPKLVGDLLGFGAVNNLAVSGGTLCADSNRTNMTERILKFNGKADIISIMLGVNDYAMRCPLGDIDSTDNKTIYGSLNLICQHLTENYPDAFVFFMTPFQFRGGENDRGMGYILPDVANAIKAVAAKYEIPVLDMYAYGRYEEEFNDPSLAYQDGIHPSQQHHIRYTAPMIAEFITEQYTGPFGDIPQNGVQSDGRVIYSRQNLISGYCTKQGKTVASNVHSYFTMDAEGIKTITITPPDAPAWNPNDIYYIVVVEEDGTVSCYGKLDNQEPTVIDLGGNTKGTVYFNAFYDDHPEYVYVKEAVVETVNGSKTISLQYDDRYDIAGKTVEIVDAGKPVSDDSAVVAIEGEKLIAKGIGTAMVKIDGVLHEVTVEKAKISLVMIMGQSNAGNHFANATSAVTCPPGTAYLWTHGATHPVDYTQASMGFHTPLLAELYAQSAAAGAPVKNVMLWTEGVTSKNGKSITAWVMESGESISTAGTEAAAAMLENCLTYYAQHSDKYEIVGKGVYWLQGESDYAMDPQRYIRLFSTMWERLKEEGMEYLAFLRVRGPHGMNDADNLDTVYNAASAAQFEMVRNNEDMFMATTLTEAWIGPASTTYSIDVSNYITVKETYGQSSRYTDSYGNQATYADGKLTTTMKELYGSNNKVHYGIFGYGLIGADAAYNMYRAFHGGTVTFVQTDSSGRKSAEHITVAGSVQTVDIDNLAYDLSFYPGCGSPEGRLEILVTSSGKDVTEQVIGAEKNTYGTVSVEALRKLVDPVITVKYVHGGQTDQVRYEISHEHPCEKGHSYTSVITPPSCTEQGYTTYTCTLCGNSYVDDYTDPRPLNILMIGNSFSWDASDFWYGMQESMTYSAMKSLLAEEFDVHLAVMYKGSATLAYHATCAMNNSGDYTYTEIGPDTGYLWQPSSGTNNPNKILDQLQKRDWDIIVIQSYQHEADGTAPRSTYTGGDARFTEPSASLGYLLDYFHENEPGAQVYYYMPWPTVKFYGADGTDSGYEAIAKYTAEQVIDMTGTVSDKALAGIIPVGTSIQNARTTYLDNLRYSTGTGNTALLKDPQIGLLYDTQHLSFGIGRYIAGLTVAECLIPQEMRRAGIQLPPMKESPSAGAMPEEYSIIGQKAVQSAIQNPFAVTVLSGYEKDPADTAKERVEQLVPEFSGAHSVSELESAILNAVQNVLNGLDAGQPLVVIQDSAFSAEGELLGFHACVKLQVGYTSRAATLEKHNCTAIVTPPTCTEPGYTTYTCTMCGYSYTDNGVPANGHQWNAATCEAPKTCTVCGKTEGTAAGHNWTAATCETPKTCSVCGKTEGNPNGHSWNAATCDKPKTCSVCGKTEGDPNGHSWNAATCDKAKTCSVCGKTEGNPNGHNWNAATCDKAKTCSVCGKTEGNPNGHSWNAATCDKPKTCTVCGKTEGNPNGHSWNPATCDKAKTCSVCGKTEGNPNGHSWNPATCDKAKTCSVCGKTEGNPNGHSWNPATCDQSKTCSVCGKTEGNPNGHLWDNGTVTKPATETTEGIMVYRCTGCGETKTVSIPRLEHIHKYEKQTVSPTCTNPGYTAYICSCGYSYQSDPVAAYGHDWVEATCQQPEICTLCGATRGEVGGHLFNSVVTEPTCTEGGYTTDTCLYCGLRLVRAHTAPLGHAWSDWQEQKPASCDSQGLRDRVCQCGARQEEILPILSHIYVDGECSFCGKREHNYRPGDADGNGEVDYMDAIAVLRYSVGLADLKPEFLAVCDLDDSNVIDYLDAVYILRISVGLV